jgi:drug/metabolite transporter (DMT)-like permease
MQETAPTPPRWQPYAALIVAMALWGSSFPAFKFALGQFDGWFLIWARTVLATLVVLPLLRWMSWARLRPGDWRWLLFMGLCEPFLYFIFEMYALRHTSSAQAGVIVALLPLMVAGAAVVTLGERLSRRLLLGLGCAVAGAIWMSLASEATASSPRPLLGNFLEFCAMVCATGYVIAVKKLSPHHSPLFLVFVQNLFGVVSFVPCVLLLGEFPGLRGEGALPSPLAWGVLLYLGTAVSLLAFVCNNHGLRHIPASRATAFGNLIPVFAVVLGVSVLGEPFNAFQFAAAGLILVGLVVSQRGPTS